MNTSTSANTTLAPPATTLPTTVALRCAVAAEWTRLWSVRSTWWALLGALAIGVGMGATFGFDTQGDGVPVWVGGEFTTVVVQFPLLVMVLLQVTAEYATGAIRSSLQCVPRRGVLLTARTGVAVIVATVAGVLTILVTDLTAWLWVGGELMSVELAASLADVAVVIGAGGLITAGLATVLRSTAGTLTSVFLLMLVLPMILPEFGVAWLAAIGEHMPGMAIALLEAMQFEDGPGGIVVVLITWILGTTAAGAWLFARRDAT